MAKKRKTAKGGSKQTHQRLDDDEQKRGTRTRQMGRRKAQKDKRQQTYHAVDDYKLRDSVESDGLTIIDMNADGNCLFRALSDQLYGDYGQQHAEVRSEVCDFMADNSDDFKVFLVFEDDNGDNDDGNGKKTSSSSAIEEDAKDFESYISTMREDGEWGGNLELVAAARLYRRKIKIFSATLAAFTIDHNELKSTGPDLLLSFHDNDHYNSVRDEKRRVVPTASTTKGGTVTKQGKKVGNTTPRGKSKMSRGKSYDELMESSSTLPTSTSATTDETSKTERTTDMDVTAESKQTPQPPPAAKTTKVIKKSAPCPCGSGLKYRKCCQAEQKNGSKKAQKTNNRGRTEEEEDKQETTNCIPTETTMKGKFRVLEI